MSAAKSPSEHPILQHLRFFILLHQQLPGMMMTKKKAAANQRLSLPIHTTRAALIPSLAPNVIAVSCVLSPSSAMKNVQRRRQRQIKD